MSGKFIISVNISIKYVDRQTGWIDWWTDEGWWWTDRLNRYITDTYDWTIKCEVWRDISLHFIRLCKPDLTAPESIRPQQSTFLPQPGEDEIRMEEMAEIERDSQINHETTNHIKDTVFSCCHSVWVGFLPLIIKETLEGRKLRGWERKWDQKLYVPCEPQSTVQCFREVKKLCQIDLAQ